MISDYFVFLNSRAMDHCFQTKDRGKMFVFNLNKKGKIMIFYFIVKIMSSF